VNREAVDYTCSGFDEFHCHFPRSAFYYGTVHRPYPDWSR
jgi:hypothetical protein